MLVLLSLFLACDLSDANEVDAPYCEEFASAIDRDDASGIGIPASRLLDALPYAQTLDLSWEDGVESELTWYFAADESTLELVEAEGVYPDEGTKIGVICPEYITVEGTLTMTSEDGRLAEELSTRLALFAGYDELHEGPLASVWIAADTSELAGSLNLSDFFEQESYDSVSLSISGEIYFSDQHVDFVGQMHATGERTDGNDVTAERIDIATWSPSLD